jgi:hypothetical protein
MGPLPSNGRPNAIRICFRGKSYHILILWISFVFSRIPLQSYLLSNDTLRQKFCVISNAQHIYTCVNVLYFIDLHQNFNNHINDGIHENKKLLVRSWPTTYNFSSYIVNARQYYATATRNCVNFWALISQLGETAASTPLAPTHIEP